tara:strand:- start:646 stop:891 length:246 start_codon:yes stop_codon:yes gene_type:complete
METNFTNIKHFKFNSVHSSTITRIVNADTNNADLISFEIMENQYNGIELTMDRNYFINSLIPFLSELSDKEKDTFKNWLGE